GVKRVLTQMPVTGRLRHGGTFAGRLTVEELTVNELGQLAATGVLAGTATPEAGSATPIPPRTVNAPASLLDLRGTCTTVVLDVEPIFLEPLSQEVTLGQSPWTCRRCQRTNTSWAPPCVPWHVSRNKAGSAQLQRPLR